MSLPGRALWLVLLALVVLAYSCGGPAADPSAGHLRAALPRHHAALSAAPPSDLRVVAVGDIACVPGKPAVGTSCRQAATAALARRLAPDLVLTLGDHQYVVNSLAEYKGSYDLSWGSLLSRTRPALGNHEYMTPGAVGYYAYFEGRQPGPPGYYRVGANGWNVYVLNSNCRWISCGAEAAWLGREMASHPSRCSIITMHHPRYSSGEHGSMAVVRPLWQVAYRHRNDVALAGHDHDYERFRAMDAGGHLRPRRGMVSFVVGTGGKNLDQPGRRRPGSAYRQARAPGVLLLVLTPGAYAWSFHSISGAVLDSGRRSCH